jgi:hypothetical protein
MTSAHLHISRIIDVNTSSLNQYLTYNIKQRTFVPIPTAHSNYTNMITQLYALHLTHMAHGNSEYELQTESLEKINKYE